MAHLFQVTVDSPTPHELADWWAEALGWTREPSDEAFIRQMVAAGHAQEADTATHRGELVWREGAAIRHPDEPAAPRVLFQLVPEPKTVKNRVHWDVYGVVGDFTTRGATVLAELPRWTVLADPEGNEFCVFSEGG